MTFRPLAPGIVRYNGCSDPCDMFEGPCACPAWHKASDWTPEQQEIQSAYETERDAQPPRTPAEGEDGD